MLSWIFGHKKKTTHILAIDLGTASISAAVVVRHEKAGPNAPAGLCEIKKVLRHPLNLLGYQLAADAGKLPYILKDGFMKVFKDAYAASRHADVILIALSEPFFLDKKTQREEARPNPSKPISRAEIDTIGKFLSEDVLVANRRLAPVGRNILAMRVNGYDIVDAIGYKGKTLGAEAVFTLVSATLKDYVDEAKEKFFPRSAVSFSSDTWVLWKLLKSTENLSGPVLVVDIGGEVTGVFGAGKNTIEHMGAAAFGIRTLARRIGAALKIGPEEVEPILRKYTAGALDERLKMKVDRVLSAALFDWWASIKNFASAPAAFKKILLSGGGADFSVFSDFLKDCLKKDYGADVSVELLRAEAFNDFLDPAGALSGGGDVILAALSIFADAKTD
ncbi:MAG: hypothetical protein HYW15_02155 [Candidatus Giovannonibacteria bacterium]|nr:MAG: hypothetical protein HYW15_02155 [Candidatus Giovannonibacteria bacterium]